MPDIGYFKRHPLRVAKPLTGVTIGQVLDAENARMQGVDMIHPATGAYIHYGGVELADTLVLKVPAMAPETWAALAKRWDASCGVVARSLLFYVWKIISREMRHGDFNSCKAVWGAKLTPAQMLVEQICQDEDYEGALAEARHVNAYDYVSAVEHHFRFGPWGGAFGGLKWADIALQIKRYFAGDQSAMMTADRCWSLQHNTGAIFNKGFYFYKDDAALLEVLDAQAKDSVFNYIKPKNTHPTLSMFSEFCQLAAVALGIPNPHGFGSASSPTKPEPEAAPSGKKVTLGFFKYTMASEEDEEHAA